LGELSFTLKGSTGQEVVFVTGKYTRDLSIAQGGTEIKVSIPPSKIVNIRFNDLASKNNIFLVLETVMLNGKPLDKLKCRIGSEQIGKDDSRWGKVVNGEWNWKADYSINLGDVTCDKHTYTKLEGYDFHYDNDKSEHFDAATTSIDKCIKKCEAKDECLGVTYNKDGYCVLKTEFGQPITSFDGVVYDTYVKYNYPVSFEFIRGEKYLAISGHGLNGPDISSPITIPISAENDRSLMSTTCSSLCTEYFKDCLGFEMKTAEGNISCHLKRKVFLSSPLSEETSVTSYLRLPSENYSIEFTTLNGKSYRKMIGKTLLGLSPGQGSVVTDEAQCETLCNNFNCPAFVVVTVSETKTCKFLNSETTVTSQGDSNSIVYVNLEKVQNN
jgi:hypothetical protein